LRVAGCELHGVIEKETILFIPRNPEPAARNIIATKFNAEGRSNSAFLKVFH